MKTIQPKKPAATTSLLIVLALLLIVSSAVVGTAQDKTVNKLDDTFLKNLQFRAIGPAIMGGRIDDIAVVRSMSLFGRSPESRQRVLACESIGEAAKSHSRTASRSRVFIWTEFQRAISARVLNS